RHHAEGPRPRRGTRLLHDHGDPQLRGPRALRPGRGLALRRRGPRGGRRRRGGRQPERRPQVVRAPDRRDRRAHDLRGVSAALAQGRRAERGGAGLDFVDLIVVLEEMGRVVLPGPFFSTVVLGGAALLEGGSAAQKKELLPKLAAGKLRVTLAQLEPSARWDAEGIALEARPAGGGYKLSGTKLFVPDAHTADLLIVAGRAPGSTGAEGASLFLVDAKAPGVSTTLLKTMDQTRKLCEVALR